MHRFVSARAPAIAPFLKSTIARPPRPFTRCLSTLPPSPAQTKTKRINMPFKTISASIALATASTVYFNSVQAESQQVPPVIHQTSSPSITLAELKDSASSLAVQAKSTDELAMALFVLRLCAIPWIVDAAPYIISISEKLHLQAPVYWFVKQTFFRHFCGGETPDECISSMDKLAQSGINCILDLSVEADLHLDAATNNGQSKYHRDEQQADVILNMIKNCVHTAAGGVKEGSMAAIKVTAFSPPELLLRLNQVISALDQAFLENQQNGNIAAEGIRKVINKVLPKAEYPEQLQQREKLLTHMEVNKATLDVIEFRKLFNLQGPARDVWWKITSDDVHAVLLTAEDLAAYDRMVDRLEQICRLAHELNVGIMVDAEQSYFQDAIDHIAVNLQRKFNHRIEGEKHKVTVYNTYQMYTKSAQGRLELDVELSKRENFTFAAKLVRGAYMVSERKRAEEMGYTSPIHESLQDTHTSYNGGVKFLLDQLRQHQEATGETVTCYNSPIVFMVASHNRDSVIMTVEEMEKNGVTAHSGVVHFGQLFGMQDQISYTLGRNGYSIYKYLPYGMIDEVIPYLLRRAQENSSVLGGVAIERQLMWDEFKSRLTGKASAPALAANPAASDVSITGTATSV